MKLQVQNRFGATRPGVKNPPLIQTVMFLSPVNSSSTPESCPSSPQTPAVDTTSGTMLFSFEPLSSSTTAAASLESSVGSYGPPAPARSADFWRQASTAISPPQGLLGRMTHNLLNMLAVKAGITDRGPAPFCFTQPYIVPIQMDKSLGGQWGMEDELFRGWGVRATPGAFVLRHVDPSAAQFDYSIAYNATLTSG